jgi:hypothetical protein
MSSETAFPPGFRKFVRENIASVEQIDVLLLLHKQPDRAWHVAEISKAVLEDLGFDRDEIINRLHYWPLSSFRISFGYTNYGITTGAQAAANGRRNDSWWTSYRAV